MSDKFELIKAYNFIVHTYLGRNPSKEHLQEIFDHGIHNMTNQFSNDSLDYEAIAHEFNVVVAELLRAGDNNDN